MFFTVDALLILKLFFEDLVEERILHILIVVDQFLPLLEELFDSITLHINTRRNLKCFTKLFL